MHRKEAKAYKKGFRQGVKSAKKQIKNIQDDFDDVIDDLTQLREALAHRVYSVDRISNDEVNVAGALDRIINLALQRNIIDSQQRTYSKPKGLSHIDDVIENTPYKLSVSSFYEDSDDYDFFDDEDDDRPYTYEDYFRGRQPSYFDPDEEEEEESRIVFPFDI